MSLTTGAPSVSNAATANGPGRPRRKRVLLLLQYYDHRHHAGVARYAGEAGWALEDAYTHLRSIPPSWEGDGIISFHGPSQEFVDWLKNARVPVVDMGEDQGLSEFPRVMTDHERIAALAAEHFAERGFKSVGFVWAWDTVVKRRRLEAFRAEAARRGLAFVETSLEQIPALATASPPAFPIGLLAATDATAVRALRACEDAGILVPEQAALMGVDNFEYRCAPARVPLTSIDPDQERVGYEAAAMLDRLMRGERPAEAAVRVPPAGVIVRDSTDMPAVADLEVARALRFIMTNFNQRIGLADVAGATAVSLRRLQTRFKRELGHTILQEINGRRVRHAQALLARTGKKIRAVAGESGFENSVKLIRVFKQYTGLSPRRYRRLERAGAALKR